MIYPHLGGVLKLGFTSSFVPISNTLWVDARRRSAIVLLRDRVHHVGESVDGCQKSLTTMFSVMLPRNPPPKNFGQLLEVFKTSRRIHRLIELNLVAGANFTLG
jgi:hypothetical protein